MTKNQIIEKLFTGKNFCDCISKMEPDHLREDLRMEVILVICELPAEKIHQLHSDKALEFYTVRVILNQIKSKTSPFAKKYRTVTQELNTHDIADNIEAEERELREWLEDMAIEEVDRLHWYNKGLIALYIKHGNFRAIETETGIPFGSCYKTIKKSLNQIKETVNKPVFSKEELRFIQNNKICSLTK
jgi:hypothetical protein